MFEGRLGWYVNLGPQVSKQLLSDELSHGEKLFCHLTSCQISLLASDIMEPQACSEIWELPGSAIVL